MESDIERALDDVDAAFARFHAGGTAPGLAWGVVLDGALARWGGLGTLRDGDDRRPDADAVFPIASMTKSFTAATLLALRDEGRLRLDDPVAAHVPALAGWRGPTADSPPVTIRHLLTMSSGLPADDPWGDRQQGLPLEAFSALLRAHPTLAWPPGTTFEYSNLGFGVLGRVVTAADGREYREAVAERVLRPLGLGASTFLAADVPPARLAAGHVRRDERFDPQSIDGYGALASMGGLLSSVRDLATWVAGFLDAFPARDDPEDGHPLSRATRREMQQVHRAIPPRATWAAADAEPEISGGGYGFGLFVGLDPVLGTTVAHGGGYPGFGSYMRWHPATGTGVVALANGRYADLDGVAREALVRLAAPGARPRRVVAPAPATLALREVATRLVVGPWDDGLADEVFAMNVDLDEPRARRRAAIERLRADLGQLEPEPGRDAGDARAGAGAAADPDGADGPPSGSPAHAAWWLRGPRGRVRVAILASPEPEPRLQDLDLRAVPDPAPPLVALAERVLALAASPAPAWPDDLLLAPGVDRAAVERGLRAAGARFGRATLGRATAGEAGRSATFVLRTERGRAELRVALEAGSGTVTVAAIIPREAAAEPEAW